MKQIKKKEQEKNVEWYKNLLMIMFQFGFQLEI